MSSKGAGLRVRRWLAIGIGGAILLAFLFNLPNLINVRLFVISACVDLVTYGTCFLTVFLAAACLSCLPRPLFAFGTVILVAVLSLLTGWAHNTGDTIGSGYPPTEVHVINVVGLPLEAGRLIASLWLAAGAAYAARMVVARESSAATKAA